MELGVRLIRLAIFHQRLLTTVMQYYIELQKISHMVTSPFTRMPLPWSVLINNVFNR